ncbi:MAG: hypothetical protein ABSE81_06645 [Candidatus Omnitrophota bacterium]|jgi:hypothetical protein
MYVRGTTLEKIGGHITTARYLLFIRRIIVAIPYHIKEFSSLEIKSLTDFRTGKQSFLSNKRTKRLKIMSVLSGIFGPKIAQLIEPLRDRNVCLS